MTFGSVGDFIIRVVGSFALRSIEDPTPARESHAR